MINRPGNAGGFLFSYGGFTLNRRDFSSILVYISVIFFSFMRLLALWIVNAVLFLVIANIVPGIEVRDFGTALWMALLWGCISITIRPLLLLLTLPVTILTLGLFTFVINGFLFWLLSQMVSGFRVTSFGAALLGALLFSLLGWAFGRAFRKLDES